MHEDRKWMMDAIEWVADGHRLKAWTNETVSKPGRCAQLVRETVEGQTRYGVNEWPVAVEAQRLKDERGGDVRYATDYEQAAKNLGLIKPNKDRKPGDILYWPYTAKDGNAYGHTAIYAGKRDGKEWVLENSDAAPSRMLERGARQPLGKGYVYLTPLSLRGEPRLTAWATSELQAAERKAVPKAAPKPLPPVDMQFTPPPVAPAPAPVRVMVNDGISGVWQDLTGKRFVISNADEVTVNATDPGTLWIRYLDRS